MKVLLFLFLSVLPFVCQAQDDYVVKGYVPRMADGVRIKMIQWYGNIGESRSADTVRNGRFQLTGKLDVIPAKMWLQVEGDSVFYGHCTLWIGPGITKVTGDDYCVPLWKIRNNRPEQREEDKFVRHAFSAIRNLEYFWNQNAKGYDAEWNDQYQKQPKMKDYPVRRAVDSLSALKMEADFELLQRSGTISKVGMEKLYRMASELKYSKILGVGRERIEQIYLRLDSLQKNSPMGYEIHNYLYPLQVAGIGDDMVDGELYDLEGRLHQLSDYKGKYILLDFWSCGCGPCVMAQPELEEVADQHRDSLFVVSINLDNSERLWRQASEKMKGINLADRKGQAGLVARYGFEGMPQFVLIDPAGKIRYKITGYGQGLLKQMIDRYWKKNNNGNKND